MSSYRSVPIGRRCPHGYDRYVCATCVAAEEEAQQYAIRQRAAQKPVQSPESRDPTVTPDMVAAGDTMATMLMNASIAKCMNGLGGSQTWDEWLENKDVPNRDLVLAYLEERITVVTATYLAMDRARRAA